MRKEKGITLVSLVVTVIVMLIISGVSIYISIENIQNNKKIAFINELKTIQAEVNIITEKMKIGSTSYDTVGIPMNEIDESLLIEIIDTCLQEKTNIQIAEFRYFTGTELEKINIKNVKQDVVINFNTREVISVKGIENEGIMCYKLNDFSGESYNI